MTPEERLAALAAVVRRLADGPAALPRAIDEFTGIVEPETLLLRRRVVRPEDLFVGDFTFPNLRIADSGLAQRLVRVRASEPAGVVLLLQGQNIVEEVMPAGEAPSRGLRAALSGPSNLAFRMPDSESSLAFTLEAILDACRRWPMTLDPRAARDDIAGPGGIAGRMLGAALPMGGTARLRRAVAEVLDATGRADLRAAVTGAAGRVLRGRTRGGGGRARSRMLKAAITSVSAPIDDDARDVARLLFDLTLLDDAADGLGFFDDFADPNRPRRPGRDVSFIEAPYRMFLSPQTGARWHHRASPATAGSFTELWHSTLGRLSQPDPLDEPPPSPTRVIWSTAKATGPDADPVILAGAPTPQIAILEKDRSDLVDLTTTRGLETEGGDPFVPTPIPVDRLTLSALGAGLELEGNWPVQPEVADVSAWRHLSSFGRDHYVRIVREGVLYPFGHRAAEIDVSERKFDRSEDGDDVIAYLEKRTFIVVRQPVMIFPRPGQAFDGRDLPFRLVEIIDRVTPPVTRGPPLGDGSAGMVQRAGTEFRFGLRLVDAGGFEHTSDMPLVFVPQSEARDADLNISLANAYNGFGAERELTFGGADMQVVPLAEGETGDVVLQTERMTLRATPGGAGGPDFSPAAEAIRAVIPSLATLAPGTDGATARTISFLEDYLNEGPGAPGGAFARLGTALAPEILSVGFGSGGASTEDAGGLMAPSMAIGTLSSALGAIGDPAEVLSGAVPSFDPREFFGDASLMGAIPIADLFDGVIDAMSPDAPEIVTDRFDDPPRTETRLRWRTPITSTAVAILEPNAGDATTILDITVCQTVFDSEEGLPAEAGETRIAARLTNFKLDLIGCLILWFDQLDYEKVPGSEAQVRPVLNSGNAVTFGGPLEFVNRLSDILPDTGLGGASVDISPAGITAGFSLAIPNVQVGVLALSNMAVGVRLTLPFLGDPVTLRFNFAEREDPFALTVSLLGGGGFFALSLDTDGVREVEAALELVAHLAFNIGVASGGACVKVGIYFRWGLTQTGNEEVELTGYLEISGELSVLGLIRIGIVFYLAFTYEKDEDAGMSSVWGIATVTVEVEVLFFSTSVELTVERRLGGSPADPGFLDFIPDQTAWDRYAAAFA